MTQAASWLLLLLAAAPGPPPPAPADEPGTIVVTGRRHPRTFVAPPRCRRRPGDPADAVAVGPHRTDQSAIAPDPAGALVFQADRNPVLGPLLWQRAGTAIGHYVFRAPEDGTPLCIGAAVERPTGWGQLRQIVWATPRMTHRYLHFSALMAATNADEIRLWLAVDGYRARLMGGDTHSAPLKGTFGWRQIDLVLGPIPVEARSISYGFLLWGSGDVWMTEPDLAIETDKQVEGLTVVPLASESSWEEPGRRVD